jgi:hypothetical protein
MRGRAESEISPKELESGGCTLLYSSRVTYTQREEDKDNMRQEDPREAERRQGTGTK